MTVEAVAHRYQTLPSVMLGYNPQDGRGLLINIALAKAGAEAEAEQETVRGRYQAKKSRWPKEVIDELKATGQWRNESTR